MARVTWSYFGCITREALIRMCLQFKKKGEMSVHSLGNIQHLENQGKALCFCDGMRAILGGGEDLKIESESFRFADDCSSGGRMSSAAALRD